MPAGSGLTSTPGYRASAGAGFGDAAGSYGGDCEVILAAGALLVGEAVYISAAGHVNKGATANIVGALGVVVGGKATKGRCYPEVKVGDVAAAAAEDWVLVCVRGKCRCIADAAVAMGVALTFGGTAGRLDDVVTDATTVVGTRIGKSLTAAGGAAAEFDAYIQVM